MAHDNLLHNNLLAEEFLPFRNKETLQTPAGWAPWWIPQREDDPGWRRQRPTFSPYEMDDRLVQQVSSPWGTHDGGLYQQVPSAVANQYELSVDGQAWSSESEEPASRDQSSNVNLQVGVDPTGGLDPSSPIVEWSEAIQPLSRWQTTRLTFTAQANLITIFLRSSPDAPKRQQAVFWRDVFLRPVGRHRRITNLVGAGDTHITLTPTQPEPGQRVLAEISSSRNQTYFDLMVFRPDGHLAAALFQGGEEAVDRYLWHYEFATADAGLYDIRFVSDRGAGVLAQRLIQVAEQVRIVPSGQPRDEYRRVYVLLPPTADVDWLIAAARGSFEGRFTVGFSADDAGVGEVEKRHILAVNPHHWPEILTSDWFDHYYPGSFFTAVIANKPADLQAWLQGWKPVTESA